LLGELEYIDRKLRRIRREHIGYMLDRTYKLVNRLRSEQERKGSK
jgi:hypothetical protein